MQKTTFECKCVKGYETDLNNRFKCAAEDNNHEFELVVHDQQSLSVQIIYPDLTVCY